MGDHSQAAWDEIERAITAIKATQQHIEHDGTACAAAGSVRGGGVLTGPRVGPPSNEYRPVCVCFPCPDEPQCGAPAAWHVLVYDAGYGVVMLASCDVHAPLARRSGQFLQEHVYDGECDMPGSVWDVQRNECVLDASGVEMVERRLDAGREAGPRRVDASSCRTSLRRQRPLMRPILHW